MFLYYIFVFLELIIDLYRNFMVVIIIDNVNL